MRLVCCFALVVLGMQDHQDSTREWRTQDPVSVQLEIRQVSPAVADTVTLDVMILNSTPDYVVLSQNFAAHLEVSFTSKDGRLVEVVNKGRGLKDMQGGIAPKTISLYAGRFVGRRFSYKLDQNAVGLVARAKFRYDVDIAVRQIDDTTAPKVVPFRGELESEALILN